LEPAQPSTEMNDADFGSVTHLFTRARAGDASAFTPLWKQFFPRLVGLAQKRLAGRAGLGSDAEDAAQAALISFWKQISTGEFLNDLRRDALWSLLATITVRKVGKQLRHQAADKRGGGKVLPEADLAGKQVLDDLIGALPTEDLDRQAAELLEGLPTDLQELTMLRLLGHSTQDISQQLNCTQRKVQRKLELVRLRWEQIVGET
jgi:RNA polymerase sigma factor (sigma-70 family)